MNSLFWWVLGIIPLGSNRDLIHASSLSTEVSAIISEMFSNPAANSLTITDAEVKNFNSFLAIVHVRIYTDDIVYEYLLPIQRIPFSNRYALNRMHSLIFFYATETMTPPSFIVLQFPGLWNTMITIDDRTGSLSGLILPPSSIIGGIIVGVYVCTLWPRLHKIRKPVHHFRKI